MPTLTVRHRTHGWSSVAIDVVPAAGNYPGVVNKRWLRLVAPGEHPLWRRHSHQQAFFASLTSRQAGQICSESEGSPGNPGTVTEQRPQWYELDAAGSDDCALAQLATVGVVVGHRTQKPGHRALARIASATATALTLVSRTPGAPKP